MSNWHFKIISLLMIKCTFSQACGQSSIFDNIFSRNKNQNDNKFTDKMNLGQILKINQTAHALMEGILNFAKNQVIFQLKTFIL